MSEPFIFITNHRIKDGKLAELHELSERFIRFVEANETRLLALYGYLSDDQRELTLVQIHPDAESMEFHLQVAAERIHEAFDVVENISIQVYGRPGIHTQALLNEIGTSGITVSIKPHSVGGFTRIAATA